MKLEKILKHMQESPKNVRFEDLAKVCFHFFGSPRTNGTSHHVYKTPWLGDPRVNIQKSKDGKAKAYQIKQVLAAINKIEGH